MPSASPAPALAPAPSLAALFAVCLKIGCFSFGGGLSGWLHREFVVRHRWALLHKSAERRGSPFPGQTYPTASVTGMPSAV